MSDRPSRQDLVVPPRPPRLGLALGAVASAAAGFVAVWALGIGRAPAEPAGDGFAPPAVASGAPVAEESPPPRPDRFSPADDSGRVPHAAHAAPPASDRYGVRPTSLDAPDAVVPAAGEAPRLSRFSQADEPAVEPVPTSEPADLAPPPAEEPPAPASEPTAGGSSPPTELDPADTVAAPTEPPESAVVALPEQAPAASLPPPASFPPPGPPADEPAPLPPGGEPAARPAGPNPLRTPAAPVAAAVPFATAPPIGPPLSPDLPPPAAPPADAGVTSGQGRPGPVQLEGVQAPQLTVEKRGPREVQVGKSARYEILVRNVGSATAHDVVLRDSVPYGAALVTTTPPASPVNPAAGGPPGDLAWVLGSLPPGGQARVAMEVMPKLEGDIGSVASVAFRADASIRSRATKPDLRIDAADPKPVLIGRDVRLPITITNPGTGLATGVVLEGLLPDALTHRAGRELEFDVGQLQPGASRTIELSLGSTGPGAHPLRLLARADGGIEAERIVKVEITAPALEIAAEMPARRYLQRPAVCTIAMTNAGTAPAKSVELAAQLPAGVKFVRANNSGYYDERTHRVLWNLEELPAGERGTVELVVMPVDLGPQKIAAAARSADGLSDQLAHTIEVEGLAAVTFDVADSEDPIEVSGLTEYVIRVGNQGTKAASGVRVAATILGEMEPVEAKGPAGHRIDNLTVSFEPLARLAPTEEAVYRIRVRGHRPGDQRVQVQLTTDDHPAPITKEEITRVYADR